MPQVTFSKLLDSVAADGCDTECIERFQFVCAVKNLTEVTMMGYAERILYLHRYAVQIGKSLTELTTRDIQQYILSILQKVSGETVNGRIRVFRLFFRILKDEMIIEYNLMESIKLVRTEKKVKPVVSPEQIGNILKQFDRNTFHGARDYCMILLTFDAMLRLNELLSIKLDDIDFKSRLVKVYGKGRKERYSPFSEITARRLQSYISRYRKGIAGEYLFPMMDGNKIHGRRAYSIFNNPARKVGINLHPHLVRHSGASHFIRGGGNPSVLQRVLGHSSLVVTQRYIHLNNNDIIKLYDNFSPGNAIGV